MNLWKWARLATTVELVVLIGCVPAVMSPTVVATPGPGKLPADLASDHIACAAQANQQTAPAVQAANNQVTGTALQNLSPEPAPTPWMSTLRRRPRCSSNTILPIRPACTPRVITYRPITCSRPTTPNRNRPLPITQRGDSRISRHRKRPRRQVPARLWVPALSFRPQPRRPAPARDCRTYSCATNECE